MKEQPWGEGREGGEGFEGLGKKEGTAGGSEQPSYLRLSIHLCMPPGSHGLNSKLQERGRGREEENVSNNR